MDWQKCSAISDDQPEMCRDSMSDEVQSPNPMPTGTTISIRKESSSKKKVGPKVNNYDFYLRGKREMTHMTL